MPNLVEIGVRGGDDGGDGGPWMNL